MMGETAPAPIYEGEDGVIAWMLDGKNAQYHVPLPAQGEAKRAILSSFTKEHSAEYQSQALIDLAFKMGRKISDWDAVEDILIETSHHTHYVIGTGANDPQKFDPHASRETLDHSIMYIVAVALQDGAWHHERSYAPERARREDTVRLWRKIHTVEKPEWTERYHDANPDRKAFGGRIIIRMKDGSVLEDELAVANAHTLGATPWQRTDYIRKFRTLSEGIVPQEEVRRFLDVVQKLPQLQAGELHMLELQLPAASLQQSKAEGIFNFGQSRTEVDVPKPSAVLAS